jgi:hypothetical protein
VRGTAYWLARRAEDGYQPLVRRLGELLGT